MLKFLNTYLENDFKLISIYKEVVFVFEKNNKLHFVKTLTVAEDDNKNHIGINSLKEATALFNEAYNFYKNVFSYDYVLETIVTPESRKKFYKFIEENLPKDVDYNFCGLVKLRNKLSNI